MSTVNEAQAHAIRKELDEYNHVTAYRDMYAGQIEQLQSEVNTLQRAVEALIVVLGSNGAMNIEDFYEKN